MVDYQNLDKITNNKEFKIERNIFTYKVSEIKEVKSDSYYFELTLEVNKIKDDIFINNNIIKLRIITNKGTFFDYFIKTLKGEWHIKQISNDELQKINGGGLSILAVAGIVSGAVFLIGVIDGYVRPKKCNE